jgi:DNA sulfur modification protein DndD
MGLRLKQIRLKNWKCYREQKIHFNLNTDKNIWIVFGQNGYGKTSLLEAILWCLYGEKSVPAKKLPDYFNRIALKKRKQIELSVQLNFEDNGKNYFISRQAILNWRGITPFAEVGEATFNEDGRERRNSREYIDSILPKACKEFFFFDGVEIQRYAQLHSPIPRRISRIGKTLSRNHPTKRYTKSIISTAARSAFRSKCHIIKTRSPR